MILSLISENRAKTEILKIFFIKDRRRTTQKQNESENMAFPLGLQAHSNSVEA